MIPLDEARRYARHQGVRAALQKGLARYLLGWETWYLTVEALRRWVNTPVADMGLEIRPASGKDLAHMERFRCRQPSSVLETWLRPDYFFSIALADGEAISYRCLSKLVHPAMTGFLLLRRDQLFMVDEFTDPAYRRRGITRQLAIATNPIVLAGGYREVIGIHRPDNLDTMAATRAKGIPTIGAVRRYRIGPKSWVTYSPRASESRVTLAAGTRAHGRQTPLINLAH